MNRSRRFAQPTRSPAVPRTVVSLARTMAAILVLAGALDVAAAGAMCMGFGTPAEAWDRDGAILECLPIERLDFAADPRDSMNVDIGLAVFRVRVTRVWKGDPDPITEISTLERVFECPTYVPRLGEPFLCWVVADEIVGNRWRIRRGLRAGESSGAAALLDAMLELDPMLTAHSRDEALLQRFSNLLDSPDPVVRLQAAAALGEFGHSASVILPRLHQLFDDATDADAVVYYRAFREIAPAGELPASVSLRMLRIGPPEVRNAALGELCRFPSEPRVRAAAVRLGIRDADPSVRSNAAGFLYSSSFRRGHLDGPGIIRELLQESTPQARLGALEAIKQGDWGRMISPGELSSFASDSSALVRVCYAKALGRLDLSGEELTLFFAPLLADIDRDVQVAAIQALGHRGRLGSDTMPLLYPLLRSTENALRIQAILALGQFPPQRDDVWSALAAGLKDADPSVRAATAAMLWRARARLGWGWRTIEGPFLRGSTLARGR